MKIIIDKKNAKRLIAFAVGLAKDTDELEIEIKEWGN